MAPTHDLPVRCPGFSFRTFSASAGTEKPSPGTDQPEPVTRFARPPRATAVRPPGARNKRYEAQLRVQEGHMRLRLGNEGMAWLDRIFCSMGTGMLKLNHSPHPSRARSPARHASQGVWHYECGFGNVQRKKSLRAFSPGTVGCPDCRGSSFLRTPNHSTSSLTSKSPPQRRACDRCPDGKKGHPDESKLG